ncbi:MAG: hypothetical protein VB878_18090 [Pirellulaceae bacterium]
MMSDLVGEYAKIGVGVQAEPAHARSVNSTPDLSTHKVVGNINVVKQLFVGIVTEHNRVAN